MHTSKGLDTVPEQGKDNSGYNAEIAEPETERRPVENGEGNVKSCTNGPVENHHNSDDNVSKS